MKTLLALAALAAFAIPALAQPGRGGPPSDRGGSSEVEKLKAKVKELEAKLERATGGDRRPVPTPQARGSSEAIARQFDRIIEELKGLKEMVTRQGGEGGRPGPGGPGGGRGFGSGFGPGGGFGGWGGWGGGPGGARR